MRFEDYIKNHITIADGGMGSMIQKLVPETLKGELSEIINLKAPEVISEIHKEYYDAGANFVLANTFGANLLKYDESKLEEIIKAAVECAKKAQKATVSKKETFIGLDVGPLGKLIKPLGEVDFDDAVRIFGKTVEIGAKYGVDFVAIETFTDLYELKAAILGAKENCDLPIIASNAYERDGRLLTGADPITVIKTAEALGVSAIGINCSFGPRESIDIINQYIENASVPVIFKPNAGLPDSLGNYNISENEFAEIVNASIKKGVRIAGGCCGSTPAHIKALSDIIKDAPKVIEKSKRTFVTSGRNTVEIGKKSIIIGERLNPTGKKILKEALKNGDTEYVLNEAEEQTAAGADILDLNVGVPGIDEIAVMEDCLKKIQAVVPAPVQIDTTNPAALERALRIYNGKPMINSVNGKKESMETVFPLAKKYGGVIVCLLLDEGGIPNDAEGRLGIARKIIDTAATYGIPKTELIFDPLCLSVATDMNAAKVTLECVKRLTEEFGVHTVLGVSNVSYGLPERDIINANFYSQAIGAGLSAGIINPFSKEMMKAYFAASVLAGIDDNAEKYIAFATKNAENNNEIITENKEILPSDALKMHIIKGHKGSAASVTEKLLDGMKVLDIINDIIVPALDEVGKLYETNKIFLPQLLMSAETAGESFGIIKKYAENHAVETVKKATFVIATVKGDIHDIGKNIVRMLLENYGYDVIDLGKDVAPETVLKAVTENNAKFLGLSALMTTTLPSMKETVRIVKESAPETKIIVGGAVLTEEYAAEIGADKYAKDAMETVNYAESN